MKCPDCKIEMELHNMGAFDIPLEVNYWKCPKCRIEIDENDENYEK